MRPLSMCKYVVKEDFCYGARTSGRSPWGGDTGARGSLPPSRCLRTPHASPLAQRARKAETAQKGGWCGFPAGLAGLIRSSAGLSGRRPAWPDAGRPGRPWPEWCVPGWPVAGLWFTIDPKNDVSQKRPERAASLNSGVFTFWNSYVGRRPAWSDWRAGGRPVVGLAGRGRPPAGLVGRWPAWPDAVRRGWTASGVVGSSRPLVCPSLQGSRASVERH